MRLIFMGTPQFAVPSLQKLLDAGHGVAAVLTQPDRPVGRHQVMTPPPVKLLALGRDLPVYQPEKIRTPAAREQFEPLLQGVDVVVVAAYGRILPEWMLAAPRLGCINVHSSLLPRYRGAAPINWAIARGETRTGVTIMQMDAGMDTGPILQQASLEIGARETAEQLSPRLAELGAALLVETLLKLERGEVAPQSQNNDEATYAPLLKREDGQIDWKMTAGEIDNRRRGFTPFPGCFSYLHGRRCEIIEAQPAEAGSVAHETLPGTIVEVARETLSVACGDRTLLVVHAVQPAGKRVMPVRDFLNGVKLEVGEKFGE